MEIPLPTLTTRAFGAPTSANMSCRPYVHTRTNALERTGWRRAAAFSNPNCASTFEAVATRAAPTACCTADLPRPLDIRTGIFVSRRSLAPTASLAFDQFFMVRPYQSRSAQHGTDTDAGVLLSTFVGGRPVHPGAVIGQAARGRNEAGKRVAQGGSLSLLGPKNVRGRTSAQQHQSRRTFKKSKKPPARDCPSSARARDLSQVDSLRGLGRWYTTGRLVHHGGSRNTSRFRNGTRSTILTPMVKYRIAAGRRAVPDRLVTRRR